MKNSYILMIIFFLPFHVFSMNQKAGENDKVIKGIVVDEDNIPLAGATVLCIGNNKGVVTGEDGSFQLKVNENKITIKVSFLGFETVEKGFTFSSKSVITTKIKMATSSTSLEEVSVTGKSIMQKISEQAFNVSVIDAKSMHNTNLDISSALDRTSGIKVRTSGGVGSNFNLSLNGFSGNQVRFFIDGIPMDNFGSSFQLNNIPIDIAERIEVYKGVVPVGLGADALGGAINIITNKQRQSSLTASYSYGSFNTHKSSVQGTYVTKSGFIAMINAYQNYSDNDYKIKVDVADINTGVYTRDETVKRFNDTYHNEMITADAGVVNKTFADELLIGISLGKNYKEIQTGARVTSVYGDLHRHGNIVMPKLKYIKRNLANTNIDMRLSANFNLGTETSVDTLHRRYNWYGQYKEYEGAGGERSYSLYEYNNNGVVIASLDYPVGEFHKISLGNVFNTFNRKGKDLINPSESDKHPRKSQKNVTGLSYNFKNQKFDLSALLKNYNQKNTYMQQYNPTGNYGDNAYRKEVMKFNFMGYGVTASYFINDNLQLKASYEKTYRMPESNELFGDMINLQGNTELEPEKSHNYNIGASKWFRFGRENIINMNLSLFYRDAYDFIRPRLNNNQIYQVMENLGNTRNKGVEFDVRYSSRNRLSAGLNLTYQDLRNYTRFEGDSEIESVVYKDRIPNMPYLFANADMSYAFIDIFKKADRLSLAYTFLYVHAFYLYWPSLGSDKLDIPTQVSHNVALTYNLDKRWQFTVECTNLLNEEIYDNFSLQKPGRSINGKIKCRIF